MSEGAGPASGDGVHIASNIYSWSVYLAREGRDFNADLDASLRLVAASGSDGLEPILDGPDSADRFGQALRAVGLQMRSAYVNTTLHEPASVEESVARVVSTARRAREYGTRIIVTNPNPIQWGGTQDKNDDQLARQAAALNRLGKELARLGVTLAYHNHDSELRQSARELHHMMVGTDPRFVKLCLDAHWIYRGAGGSQVALFDILKLYHKRIVELHVRQSNEGVWSEVFGPGDIDYDRLAGELKRLRVAPHIVLEQAAESGTPRTMLAQEAMRLSTERVRSLFTGVGRR
jgi:inosose dehydratase